MKLRLDNLYDLILDSVWAQSVLKSEKMSLTGGVKDSCVADHKGGAETIQISAEVTIHGTVP